MQVFDLRQVLFENHQPFLRLDFARFKVLVHQVYDALVHDAIHQETILCDESDGVSRDGIFLQRRRCWRAIRDASHERLHQGQNLDQRREITIFQRIRHHRSRLAVCRRRHRATHVSYEARDELIQSAQLFEVRRVRARPPRQLVRVLVGLVLPVANVKQRLFFRPVRFPR